MNKIIKQLVNRFKDQVRRNERRQHTKKAKKAHIYVIYAIAFMLVTEFLINTVQAAFLPDPIVIEGKPLSWDTRIAEESVAVTSGDESKDGVVVIGGIEELIEKYFGEYADQAKKIAICESTLDKTRTGDQSLSFEYNGQTYGESYGLFQIRSGGNEKGKIWVRTDNVEEFKKEMFIPEKNIEKAAKMFKESGNKWNPWHNCMIKNNL